MLKDRNFLCCTIFTALGILLSVIFFNHPIHDYGNYYFGSRFAMEGVSVRDIYEPYRFNLLIRGMPGMEQQLFLENYAVVPPPTLWFFIPFTFLDVHASKLLFNLLSVLFFSFSLLRLLRELKINSPWVWVLPLIMYIPFRNNILFGQSYLFIIALLLQGFIAEKRNKNFRAAIFYALPMALKISPAILLLYLLARRKYKLTGIIAFTAAILFSSAAVYTGWNFLIDYLSDHVPRMALNEINNPFATNYQTIVVLLRNLFIHDPLLNPSAIFDIPFVFHLLTGAFTGIIFYIFWKKMVSGEDLHTLFAFAMLTGVIVNAYSVSYSLVFLIPVCVEALRRDDKMMVVVLALLFLVANVPIRFFETLPLFLRFSKLYLLIAVFLLFVRTKKMQHQLSILGIFLTAFISVSFFNRNQESDASRYFLQKEEALLIYDFDFKGNDVYLKVIEESGPVEKKIELQTPVYSIQPFQLKENQVYFKRQLTFGKDHKRNPVLVNNNEIVYLSDKNRGIGFYTLRKIRVQD